MPAKSSPVKKAAPKKVAAARVPAQPRRAGPPVAAEQKFLERFGKNFGKDTIIRGADVVPYPILPTGSLTLDFATGVGGLVEGRVYETSGPPGVGKSAFQFATVVEAQLLHPNKNCAWIDMEHRFDKPWAIAHGINPDLLFVYQPGSAEDLSDAVKEFIRSGLFSFVVIDSVGAMISEAEIDKDAGEATVGKVPAIVTRMVKTAAVEAEKTLTTIMVLNQLRAAIGAAPKAPQTTNPGGWALKHGTTMKFDARKASADIMSKVGDTKMPVGHKVSMRIMRNSVAPRGRVGEFILQNQPNMEFGNFVGVDRAQEAFDIGVRLGIILKGGSWYTLPESGERLNGEDAAIIALRAQPEMISLVRTRAISTRIEDIYTEEKPLLDPETGDVLPNFDGIDSLDDGLSDVE